MTELNPMEGTRMVAPERIYAFIDACARNPELRSEFSSDPRGYLADKGFGAFPDDFEIKVVENTADTFHVAMPPDPNLFLMDEDLGTLAGGKTASTAGSAGSASTIGSVMTTIGSASTFGCAGSAGTAG